MASIALAKLNNKMSISLPLIDICIFFYLKIIWLNACDDIRQRVDGM